MAVPRAGRRHPCGLAAWPMPSPDDYDYSGVADQCRRLRSFALYVGHAGTEAETVADCRRTLEIMMPGGGYCFAPTHQIQDNTPTENVLAMYAMVKTCGVDSPSAVGLL